MPGRLALDCYVERAWSAYPVLLSLSLCLSFPFARGATKRLPRANVRPDKRPYISST